MGVMRGCRCSARSATESGTDNRSRIGAHTVHTVLFGFCGAPQGPRGQLSLYTQECRISAGGAAKGVRVRKHWKKLVVGVVLLAVLGSTAGVWVYIHWIKADAPKRLTIDDVAQAAPNNTTGSGAATGKATGNSTQTPTAPSNAWKIAGGSQVGYRVIEVLFGQNTEGVGRSGAITGSLTLDGTVVSTATFTVDMTTLKSDDARRDRKFTGQIMSTASIPTATFTLTKPIDLDTVPSDGQQIAASATGDMHLHGVTKPVTFDLTAKRSGTTIAVSGSFDVKFADYDITNPSGGPVTTQDHGLIEFALAFTQR